MTAETAGATERLIYSPLSFLRDHAAALAQHERARVADAGWRDGLIGFGGETRCWFRRLDWDSNHFGRPIHRLEQTDHGRLGDGGNRAAATAGLARALRDAAGTLAQAGGYLFGEVPAEDVVAVQALGMAGYRLVETRLTYFNADLGAFEWEPRHPVRDATWADRQALRETAATTRNMYDRYHADPAFSDDEADAYLGTYAAESVERLADFVLVPDDVPRGSPADALFTARVVRPPACPVGLEHACDLGIGMGRIVLVAVGPDRRGWHLKLMAEATHRFRDEGLDVAVMTTQASNRAVIHNSERLGYRLGRTAHVFATSAATRLT